MEETVKQRLVKYLRFKSIGQNKFEAMAGIGNGYISNLKIAPGTGHLTKILNAAPDLNERWLMTGQGEMLKTEKKEEEPRPTMNVTVDKDTLIKLMMYNMRMSEQNDELRKQVDELLQRINNLEEEVRETKKDTAKSSHSDSANNQQEDFEVS